MVEKSGKILIKSGRVLDPTSGFDQEADVLIESGRIKAIDKGINMQVDHVIDARKRWVAPGLIDIHVHFRVPGQEYKEDIESGSLAAAAGGFSSVCCMANTTPVNDDRTVTQYISNRAKEVAQVRVHPIAAMTKGLRGEELCDYADLKAGGAVALSDDGVGVRDSTVMRNVLSYAKTNGLLVMQHCEDLSLSQGGAAHEGEVALRLGIPSQPAEAEAIMLARDIELVALTGAPYHALHLSCEPSLRLVREAKKRGLPVTCEVAPHHFTFTDEACSSFDTAAKVNPPLRGKSHVDAVIEAIVDGTADAIACDHAPHAVEDKDRPFEDAAFGISGIETSLSLSLQLCRKEIISPLRLIELMSTAPSRIMNLNRGEIKAGAVADITVIDPEMEWQVSAERMYSKGKNTPLLGKSLRGAAVATIVDGKVAYSAKQHGR